MLKERWEYAETGTFCVEIDTVCYQIPKHCPHRAGRLDYGSLNVKLKTVTCPLHKSVFRLETGEQIAGPPCGSLAIERK